MCVVRGVKYNSLVLFILGPNSFEAIVDDSNYFILFYITIRVMFNLRAYIQVLMRFSVENSPAIVFRPIHCGRSSAQDCRNDRRPIDDIPQSRRCPRAVAWSCRSNGAHRRRVVRAIEHNGLAGRGARQTWRVNQGPEVLEHSDMQHVRWRVHGHSYVALRLGIHPALQPRFVYVNNRFIVM